MTDLVPAGRGVLEILGLPDFTDPDLPRQIKATSTEHLLRGLGDFGNDFKGRSTQIRYAVGCVVHVLRGRMDDPELRPYLETFAELTGFAYDTVRSWANLAVPQLGPVRVDKARNKGRGGRPKKPKPVEVLSDQTSDQPIREGTSPLATEIIETSATESGGHGTAEEQAGSTRVEGEESSAEEAEAPDDAPDTDTPGLRPTDPFTAELFDRHDELETLLGRLGHIKTEPAYEKWIRDLDRFAEALVASRRPKGSRQSTPYSKAQQVGGKR